MTEKSRQEQIAECVTILAESYRQRVSELTFKTYDIGLSDLDINDIKRAVVRAIRECRFMPTVFELRDLCGAGGTSIDRKDKPLAAWQAVRAAIRTVGSYGSVEFSDPVVNAVIRSLGGWPEVCATPPTELVWLEKRFCAMYSALAGAKLPEDEQKRLPGLFEVDNARQGYLSEPVRVAHVACLTGSGDRDRFVEYRLEEPARRPVRLVNELAKSLAVPIGRADEQPAGGYLVSQSRAG